jgi:two-component system sensor histidine kinase RcsD
MEKVIYSQATTLEIQLLPLYCPIPLKRGHHGLNISMSQSETTAPSKFSLLPGSITRFFLLLIIVLLVTMGVMVQSAVNAWLKDKSYQVVDITHAVHKRIDTGATQPGRFTTILPLHLQRHPGRVTGNAPEAGRLLP